MPSSITTSRLLHCLSWIGGSFALSVGLAATPTITVSEVHFTHDGRDYASRLVVPASASEQALPGLLMIPNWLGVTEAAVEKASRIAAMGYVVYVADVYTASVRPTGPAEAGRVAGALRADREEMRARIGAAWQHFRSLQADTRVPDNHYAAIGFCFGGGAVLEFARTGTDLRAVVSFHGDLLSPTLAADSRHIRARVLVLHGAADPYVPPAHVAEWESAMRTTQADWQLIAYGGAVHSFTDPHANQPGQAMYDARTANRSFAHMRLWLDEAFAAD